MAINVKFLKGTAEKFATLQKVADTFYLVDETDLYLGDKKLSNASDLAAAVTRIAKNETDIVSIFTSLQTLNGDADKEGSVAKAIADAKTEVYGKIGTVPTKEDGSAQTVVEYIDAKVAEAAGDASDVASDLASYKTTNDAAVKANADAIAAINNEETGILKVAKDYADEIVGDLADGAVATAQSEIDALEELVGTLPTEGTKATTVVGYVDEQVAKAVTDATYDDTAVKVDIKANADAIKVLNGDDTGKSVRTIANEELAAQLIPETAKESLDTLQEIAAWIQDHPDDASAMNEAIEALKTLVGTIPEGVTATTIVGMIQELVSAEETRATGVEEGLDGRIEALENKFEGDGSVESLIATAKSEAITASNEYADGLASNYDPAGSASAVQTNLETALTWGEF